MDAVDKVGLQIAARCKVRAQAATGFGDKHLAGTVDGAEVDNSTFA